jgi:hypothetical protein
MRDFLVGKIGSLGSDLSGCSSCLCPRLAFVLWLLGGLRSLLSFLGGRLGRSALLLRSLLLLLVLCGTRGLYTRGRESERLSASETSWRSTDKSSRSRRRPRGQRCSASICGECRIILVRFLFLVSTPFYGYCMMRIGGQFVLKPRAFRGSSSVQAKPCDMRIHVFQVCCSSRLLQSTVTRSFS